MSVALVDVADLVAIAAIAETAKADTEDVIWEMRRKVVLLANSPPHSAAVLAEVVVLLPLEGYFCDPENAPSSLKCYCGETVACLVE